MLCLLLGRLSVPRVGAQDADDAPPDWLEAIPADPEEADLATQIAPAIEWYCLDCHDRGMHKGGVVLDGLGDTQDIVEQYRMWERAIEQIEQRTMPPMDADQPPEAMRQHLALYLRHVLDSYDAAGVTDPGPAVLRRLTHAEYNNTVRDLTGVDMKPAATFPADGGGGEGFTNNADTLFLSPLLFERYMQGAQHVLDRTTVSITGGVSFHEEAVGPRDRQAYRDASTQAVRDYRYSMLEPYGLFVDDTELIAEYLPALFRYRYAKLADETLMVEAFAQDESLSPHFLSRLEAFVVDGIDADDNGPMQQILRLCRAVPAPDGDRPIDEQLAPATEASAAVVRIINRSEKEVARWFGEAADKRSFIVQTDNHARLARMVFAVGEDVMLAGMSEAQRGELDRLSWEDHLRREATAEQEAQAAREMLAEFAPRAFRRPLVEGELESLVAFFKQARTQQATFELAMQTTLKRILVSPHFLFRVEVQQDSDGPYRISGIELANRLSYLIWSSMPDEALLAAAQDGRLFEPEVLEAQVRRMLADEKAQALATEFVGQWVGLSELDHHPQPDAEAFTGYDAAIRDAMQREVVLFVSALIREDRPTLALIDGAFTFVNQPLAAHYGLAEVEGDAFVRITTADTPRGGLLGMGAFHQLTSYPTRSSPVLRGQWVLGRLLGTPAPPPPPDAGDLPADADAQALSLRARLELHRQDAACAVCHDRLDPVGFALSRFDAVGRYVETDRDGRAIDASGTMPDGTALDGVDDLRSYILSHREQFYRQIASKSLGYALGREVEFYDRPTLRHLESRLGEDDRFSTLIIEIVMSYPFQHRRPPLPVEEGAGVEQQGDVPLEGIDKRPIEGRP